MVQIIDKTLKHDARKAFDAEAYIKFKQTLLRVSPTSGTSTTSVDLGIAGVAPAANNVELRSAHVKAITDIMKERDIQKSVLAA